GGNNSATATTAVQTRADLSVTKTDSPDPVTAGTNLTYTITLTNNGPSDAQAVSLADSVPATTTFVSLTVPAGWSCTTPAVGGTGPINCTKATLAAGGSAIFTLVVTVAPSTADGATISNTATAATTTTDPSGGNNSATATTAVQTRADLSVTKTDSPDPVTAGTNLTYTITLTNNGPSDAQAVSLADSVPATTTFVSLTVPAGWSCTTPAVGGTGPINCTKATLAAGGSAIFTLVVTVAPSTADGATISNTATAATTTTDPSGGNNSATATTAVQTRADLSVTKTDSPDPVTAGTNLTYTITLTNNGPSDAQAVSLADSVPATTTFVSLTVPAGWSCTTPAVGGTGPINCTKATLAAGGSAIFTLVVTVAPSTADGATISNTATAATTTTDPSGGNNSATATTAVQTRADLSVTKTDSPDPVTAGTNLTYTITLTNNGPSDAQAVSLADSVPASTTFVSLTVPAGWSCTTPAVGGTGPINCTKATLAAGGSAIFTLVVTVAPSTADGATISNTATAATTTTDPSGGNNSATATTAVQTRADLSVTKTDSPDPVTAGTNLTYTITLA